MPGNDVTTTTDDKKKVVVDESSAGSSADSKGKSKPDEEGASPPNNPVVGSSSGGASPPSVPQQGVLPAQPVSPSAAAAAEEQSQKLAAKLDSQQAAHEEEKQALKDEKADIEQQQSSQADMQAELAQLRRRVVEQDEMLRQIAELRSQLDALRQQQRPAAPAVQQPNQVGQQPVPVGQQQQLPAAPAGQQPNQVGHQPVPVGQQQRPAAPAVQQPNQVGQQPVPVGQQQRPAAPAVQQPNQVGHQPGPAGAQQVIQPNQPPAAQAVQDDPNVIAADLQDRGRRAILLKRRLVDAFKARRHQEDLELQRMINRAAQNAGGGGGAAVAPNAVAPNAVAAGAGAGAGAAVDPNAAAAAAHPAQDPQQMYAFPDDQVQDAMARLQAGGVGANVQVVPPAPGVQPPPAVPAAQQQQQQQQPAAAPNLAAIQPPAAQAAPPNAPEEDLSGLESFNSKMDNVNLGGAVVSSGWGLAKGFLDADAKVKDGKYIADKKETYMDKPDRFIGGGLTTITSSLGIIGNSGKLDYNRRKRKQTADKRKRTALTFSSISNAFGMAANFSKLGAGISSLSSSGSDAKEASKWLGGIGTVLNMFATGTTFVGDLVAKHQRNKLVERLGNNIPGANRNGPTLAHKKQNVEALKGTAGFADELRSYKSLKSREYALAQAKKMNEAKQERYPKGVGSFIGSVFGGIGSLVTSFNKDASQSKEGMQAGGFMPAIGLLGTLTDKVGGAISDKRVKDKMNGIKLTEIRNYLSRKRADITKDANQAFGPQVQIQMSDNEKDRVSLARLGLDNIDIINAPVNEKLEYAAFEKLNLKRAQELLDSDEKDVLLGILGLDTNASLKQVADALKGE